MLMDSHISRKYLNRFDAEYGKLIELLENFKELSKSLSKNNSIIFSNDEEFKKFKNNRERLKNQYKRICEIIFYMHDHAQYFEQIIDEMENITLYFNYFNKIPKLKREIDSMTESEEQDYFDLLDVLQSQIQRREDGVFSNPQLDKEIEETLERLEKF